MIKQIVFTEEEFGILLSKFVDNFLEYSKKGYGNSLISNETGKTLITYDEIGGAFIIPWNKTFKETNNT